jgi:hypothetical protein
MLEMSWYGDFKAVRGTDTTCSQPQAAIKPLIRHLSKCCRTGATDRGRSLVLATALLLCADAALHLHVRTRNHALCQMLLPLFTAVTTASYFRVNLFLVCI